MVDIPDQDERVRAEEAYLRLHRTEPDYTQPRLEITDESMGRILSLLELLYGVELARAVGGWGWSWRGWSADGAWNLVRAVGGWRVFSPPADESW